ncbi:ABC transporter ATP-binding protein [Streptobacillus canis]|uniref:ABC transporter ATP-binding protein n=1 Tax=Streptobacillus canis TaxID=2678686 RepID=UPI0012E13906|nr:ATP-binding cassette domain-containing protein [Streptobacillus canis]
MKVQEPSIIKVENLCKDFTVYKRTGLFKRSKSIVRVVNSINFEIEEGEVVGFLGPNGAGKSTTIKMMTGILTPTEGKCLVNKVIPYENRVKNSMNIGAVFGQRTALWVDLSVEDNLYLLKEMYGLSDERYKERFEYLNEILSVTHILHKQVRTLSLGQRMLADLIASLLHSPKVLFLDEPTIGLDIILKEKLLNILKEINKKEKITIILTTHDMRDVEALCDRIIVINQGTKIFDDSLENLKNNYVKHRLIKARVRDIENIDINHIKNNGIVDTYIDDNYLNIVIENNESVEKNTIIELYNNYEVVKLELEEENIDSIIKRIYEKKIKG